MATAAPTSTVAPTDDLDTKSPQGVYKNPRLMHVCTTIVGFTVHLQTKDGQVWEGIFNTFNHKFTVCLDLAVTIDPKLDSKDCLYKALKSGLQVSEHVYFDLKDIVRITVVDVDLNYATKEMDKVTTDADISGFNSSKVGETRELESWQDDDGDNANDDSLLSLDEVASTNKNGNQNNSRTGWDPTEMFRYNERVHKVNTTYDDELQDYTIALPKHNRNDRDWRRKQERAAAIAREIENNPQSQGRLAKEDGSDDEEEKFSAVVRPTGNQQQQVDSEAPSLPSPHQQRSKQQQHQQPQHQQSQQQPQQQVPSVQAQQQSTGPLSSTQQQSHQHPHANQHPHSNLHPHPHPHPQSHNHQQQVQHQHLNQHQQPQHTRMMLNRINNGTHNKNFRNPRYDRRLDSLKNFGKALTLAPSPRQPQGIQGQPSPINQNQSPSLQQSQPKPTKPLIPNQQILQSQSNSQAQSQPNQQTQPQQQYHHHRQHQSQMQQHPQHQQHQQPQSSPQQQPPQHPPQLQQQQSQLSHHQQQQSQPQSQPQQPQQLQNQQQHHQHQQHQHQHQHQQQPQQHQQQQSQILQSDNRSQTRTDTASVNTTTTSSSNNDTSMASERSDVGSSMSGSQTKDQSEIARRSKLNPNAKEFVYKPRSPAVPATQTNGANIANLAIDPVSSSPMSQAAHGHYYPQVPIFPHGLSPHQQQHHAAQFIPNHAHMHAFHQSQIHYMPTPMPPHFAPQQMSPRYIRGNFSNYHHRGGEHLSNVRAAYSQAPIVAPTSATGQQFVPPQSGAPPHPMNTYSPAGPQQQIIYGGPHQSVYPMVPAAGFPQHMQHMPNPPPYDGGAVYMPPSQNYVVNPQQ